MVECQTGDGSQKVEQQIQCYACGLPKVSTYNVLYILQILQNVGKKLLNCILYDTLITFRNFKVDPEGDIKGSYGKKLYNHSCIEFINHLNRKGKSNQGIRLLCILSTLRILFSLISVLITYKVFSILMQ